MSLFDALFGRTRIKKPRLDALFALVTAQAEAKDTLGIRLVSRAALLLKPQEGSRYDDAQAHALGVMELVARDHGLKITTEDDPYGFRWVKIEGQQLEDVVTAAHAGADTLTQDDFGEALMALVLAARDGTRPFYLVYSYKRSAFYAFAPQGQEKTRDNAEEIRLSDILEKLLPMESDPAHWYALWDLPLAPAGATE